MIFIKGDISNYVYFMSKNSEPKSAFLVNDLDQ